ncbi:GNAT family N-acetyltransferase [Kribbella albertanoniae]|uniref:GNAT family N-acetyltransferase n=1 Tax=Kribbella albertanoniae TaxID=1266829 RepID=A0A4R4PYF2_9ACTN|nr:GNAT family N-acetyltransferase [Kribbella albertanoniae]TDC27626.1 GNAT family N-acetyltransferase [Kribbella albertanoniae]
MMELQELTSDDWKVWRDLRLAALAEAPYAFGSTLADWVDAPEERWRARLEAPGVQAAVVLIDGTPIGMGGGAPAEAEGVFELVSMWVAPAGRGKGVGDLLMAWLERIARAQGAHTLELAVAEGNDKAIGLYERSGYVVTGAEEEGNDGRILKLHIMHKSL